MKAQAKWAKTTNEKVCFARKRTSMYGNEQVQPESELQLLKRNIIRIYSHTSHQKGPLNGFCSRSPLVNSNTGNMFDEEGKQRYLKTQHLPFGGEPRNGTFNSHSKSFTNEDLCSILRDCFANEREKKAISFGTTS